MNQIEAGILPSIPIGAIAGGIVCKSYGVLATIGGVLAGSMVGGCVGLFYGCYIGLLIAIFGVLWGALRGERDPREEVVHIAASSGKGYIVLAVLSSGILGLVTEWYLGVIVAALLGIFIAIYATARSWYLGKQRPNDSCQEPRP
jgi:hypothetical protein